ncbi:MAG: hypothetical protein GKC04_06490 [Methanomicrobiales archaeon]|nr:hypothetical protein [Methanomicrobiales archaeon]
MGRRIIDDDLLDGTAFFEEKEYRRQKREFSGSRDKTKNSRDHRRTGERRPKDNGRMRFDDFY